MKSLRKILGWRIVGEDITKEGLRYRSIEDSEGYTIAEKAEPCTVEEALVKAKEYAKKELERQGRA